MPIDWTSTLQERANFVKQIADDVDHTLKLPSLSDVQVLRPHRVLEQSASTFDRIFAGFGADRIPAE